MKDASVWILRVDIATADVPAEEYQQQEPRWLITDQYVFLHVRWRLREKGSLPSVKYHAEPVVKLNVEEEEDIIDMVQQCFGTGTWISTCHVPCIRLWRMLHIEVSYL